ncbi:adenylate/guanylate cyclase domain-containing protein [Hyalangium versicolor]|uniref:adenylate/guanylate cyclase domain-containing protein n=1 Tax=Hyalangium versicolor TaxID=2861190 RepID=UPI001CC90563|nr:adenylate/guanylate cyclase domain-containing protein [Hyalangium versicolor]
MTPAELSRVQTWLLHLRHVDDGGLTLMAELIAQLRAQGLPLWRCSFNLMTKHPELVWRTVQWTEEQGVKPIDRQRLTLDDPYFTRSPVALLLQGSSPIRVRLDRDDLPFPICQDLRALGGTDYFAQGLQYSTGDIGYISWATRAPGGFSEESLAALTALSPHLAQRIELASAYHATRALLEVYLGRNAGQRVANGGFRRGSGELIDAAIWFCDLRDFTSLSEQGTPQATVKTLDEYFDHVAGAVMERGGEVLKFIGDAILAIFPVADDAHRACQNALLAAEEALASLQKLNVARRARGDGPLSIGVALHLGQVMYGNIGARGRLDFTVISSSVNEACRLEALCKPLQIPLTLSEAFVQMARPEAAVDLGSHALKGVRAPIRVFTLKDHLPEGGDTSDRMK